MKNAIPILLILFYTVDSCFGQIISVANERENILTVGLDNPLIIAVENVSSKSIVAKADNGDLKGKNGVYTLRPENVGRTTITVFKNVNGKLNEIGKKYFRAKLLWDPVFKIGSGKRQMPKAEIVAQHFVRAELENSDFELRFRVDSFKVCFIRTDTCSYITKLNIGNEISKEINQEFQKLKVNDTLIFKDIYCTGPGGQRRIEPVLIFISE